MGLGEWGGARLWEERCTSRRQSRERARSDFRDPGLCTERRGVTAAEPQLSLLVDLLGQIALRADLLDDVELGLEPVGAVLLAVQNLLEELAAAVVALLPA